MASLLRHEFPELDMDKVVNMCLIHDLGECFTGDIPTFNKTDQDRDIEDALLDEWVDSLPKEVSDYMKALYTEMNAQKTKESKLYKALDKLAADYRQALWLVYFEELTVKEASAVMKKSTRQITNLLYRAKQSLKNELEKGGFVYEEF